MMTRDLGEGVEVIEFDELELALYSDGEGLILALWVAAETGATLGIAPVGLA